MYNTEKLTTIRLTGQLGQKFGKTHKYYVSSAGEAVRAMCSQLDGFAKYLRDPERKTLYKVLVANKQIDPEHELNDLSGNKEIRIAPVISGAKSGMFQVIVGVALIALAFTPIGALAMPFGMAGTLGTSMLLPMGAALMLGGAAAMISPQPKLDVSESPSNTPNTSLGGVTNNSAQGSPVPLAYGRVRAGSVCISAGIYSSDTNG